LLKSNQNSDKEKEKEKKNNNNLQNQLVKLCEENNQQG
jgi:hypothetical protein